LRQIVHPDGDLTEYVLRVAAAHTLGNAGVLGSDEQTFPTQHELAAVRRYLMVQAALGKTRHEAPLKFINGALLDELI
jgi:hypothetical protein